MLDRAYSCSCLGLERWGLVYMAHQLGEVSVTAELEREELAAAEVSASEFAVGHAVELTAQGAEFVSPQEPSYSRGETCSSFLSAP